MKPREAIEMNDIEMQKVADHLESMISAPHVTLSEWLQNNHPEIYEEYIYDLMVS